VTQNTSWDLTFATKTRVIKWRKKLELSNPEREVSHEDVEDWIPAYKGIVQSRTVADGALIDAVMNPSPES